jgi:hypothetical protein
MQRHGKLHEVERPPVRLIVTDDERAIRHAVGDALDQRGALVVRIARGDDLDRRKRDDELRDLVVTVGCDARRGIAQEAKRDLRLHPEQRHVLRIDGGAAPHDPRPQQHAVAHAPIDHAAHLVARHALASLTNGCRLDGERIVDRRGAAVFGQAEERDVRAAGRDQQRGRVLDRGRVHCGGNTRTGFPASQATAFSTPCSKNTR